MADYLGTDHTDLIVTPDPVDMFARLAEAYDQPFADSSAIPTLLLRELASREVVVALSSDGGDECFGGYVRYRAAEMLQRMNPVWAATSRLADPMAAMAERAGQRRVARPTRHMTPMPNLGVRYRGLMEYQPSEIRDLVWTPEARAAARPLSTDLRFQATWDA